LRGNSLIAAIVRLRKGTGMSHKKPVHEPDAATTGATPPPDGQTTEPEVVDSGAQEACDDTLTEATPVAPRAAGEPASTEGLAQKLAATEDKYIRLLAEFDNFKRRTLRERDAFVESANQDLMQEMIDVRENFQRALANGGAVDAAALGQGMKLIFAKFDQVLGAHGLAPFGEPGEAFDPALHDALLKASSEDVSEDHLMQVMERGYRLRGRVIKHARVIVSSGRPPAPAASAQAQPDQPVAD
jgi:molecular chaperone GrpE